MALSAGRIAVTLLAAALSMSADVKFTRDQCRVLQQIGVDTTGICPQPKPSRKR
jgi:hypothetical protein